MSLLVPILLFIVVVGPLIAFHEFGHYIVAKLNGVKVLEYNIGFGRPIVQFQRGETKYGLRVIPLGGYVRLAGMDDGDAGPRSFNAKPVWRRITIIVAGAFANLVLPIAIFFVAGVAANHGPVTVQAVTDNSPAQAAGIRPDDRLVSINGKPVSHIEDLRSVVGSSSGAPVRVGFARPGGPTMEATIKPVFKNGRWIIGVVGSGGPLDIPGTAVEAVKLDGAYIVGIPVSLVRLASGQVSGGITGPCGVSGPIGIARETQQVASAGIIPVLFLAGVLSVSVGILNLLPVPALDGGRLLFLIIEAVRRKPMDPALESRVHYAGFVVLITLILIITFNDISRLQTPFASLISQCQ
jgi:regulator of sigma E protease